MTDVLPPQVDTVVVSAGGGRDALRTGAKIASKYGTIIALGIIVIIFACLSPSAFFTTDNLINILSDVSIAVVIAGGLTLALIVAEYDLSIGYVGSFAGVLVTGLLARESMPLALAIVVTLAVSAAIGLVNGIIVTKAGVNSFITTLATGTVVVGLNFLYNSGVPTTLGIPRSFVEINLTRWARVPVPVYIAAVIALLLWLLLNRTVFGFNAQAIGQNAEAARLAGVPVTRVRILCLVISALCAGAGGILLAAKLGSGQTSAADGYLLQAFAACFLGSVALRDSEFHILGTVIGVVTVGVAFNGLAIVAAPPFWQYVLQGGLLAAAVAVSTIGRRILSRN